MKVLKGNFSFKVPATHADAVKREAQETFDLIDSPTEADNEALAIGLAGKVAKTFEFRECENDNDVKAILTEKEWTVIGLVNDALKTLARSNAYQTALVPYKAKEYTPDEIEEKMVRSYMLIPGITESAARQAVKALLASQQ